MVLQMIVDIERTNEETLKPRTFYAARHIKVIFPRHAEVLCNTADARNGWQYREECDDPEPKYHPYLKVAHCPENQEIIHPLDRHQLSRVRLTLLSGKPLYATHPVSNTTKKDQS